MNSPRLDSCSRHVPHNKVLCFFESTLCSSTETAAILTSTTLSWGRVWCSPGKKLPSEQEPRVMSSVYNVPALE